MNKKMTEFLKTAKKKTYASLISIPRKTKDGGTKYIYTKGNFTYEDIYHGEMLFIGQEKILENNKTIWLMNYAGGLLGEYRENKKCYGFLKSCLKKLPEDFPLRGPKHHKEGDFEYKNEYSGNIEKFSGVEKIFFKGKRVYLLNYHGGLVNE